MFSVQGEPDVLQPGPQQQRLRALLRAGHPLTQQISNVSALDAAEARTEPEEEGKKKNGSRDTACWERAPPSGESPAITNCENGAQRLVSSYEGKANTFYLKEIRSWTQ